MRKPCVSFKGLRKSSASTLEALPLLAKITATLSGLIHVLFFYMESIAWLEPNIYEAFQVATLADAEVLNVYVKNQGYYNLFLALGMFVGLATLARSQVVAKTLIGYISAVMFGAAVVLLLTIPEMIVGVCLQGIPAAITLVALWLENRNRVVTT